MSEAGCRSSANARRGPSPCAWGLAQPLMANDMPSTQRSDRTPRITPPITLIVLGILSEHG
jgi:hypothetical protein